MPAAQIKICGLTSAAALDAAIAARADYVGLNFYPPSPRYLALNEAPALAAQADRRIGRIGVFVDASDVAIGDAIAAARLDAIQLHGSETPARAAELKARFGLPVWKALPVASRGEVAKAQAYVGAADLVLFDAKTPKGTLPGGMGLTFDWSLLRDWNGALPWGLAGGLDASNVSEAIRQTRAPLIDTSSGVESAPGIKDIAKIAAFCAAVHSA